MTTALCQKIANSGTFNFFRTQPLNLQESKVSHYALFSRSPGCAPVEMFQTLFLSKIADYWKTMAFFSNVTFSAIPTSKPKA